MTDLHDRIERKKKDMENARLGMAQGIKYSSRSLGGHTTQYRRLCRLAGIEIDLPEIKEASPAKAIQRGVSARQMAATLTVVKMPSRGN